MDEFKKFVSDSFNDLKISVVVIIVLLLGLTIALGVTITKVERQNQQLIELVQQSKLED